MKNIEDNKDKLNEIVDKGQLVVKDNDLIQKAKYNLTAIQQKIICYAISKIKPTDAELYTVDIDVKKFCDLCGIDTKHFYKDFRDIIQNLADKSFWVERDNDVYLFRWFSKISIEKRSGIAHITLNDDIKSYLIDLSNNFTKYELWNILSLKSKYAIRLYEYFKSYSYQKSIIVEVQELKKMLFAETYTDFRNFRRRVVDIAVDQINECTDLSVDYETIKEGYSIKYLKFYIDNKSLIEVLEDTKEKEV